MQPEVFSALVGACVGGGISCALQIAIFFREKKSKASDELARNQSSFLGLWFQIEKSREFIDRLDEILQSAKSKQKSEGIKNISLVTGIIYTNVEKSCVTERQMYFLSRYHGDVDVSYSHRFLDNVRIMLDLTVSYREKREKLFDIMPEKLMEGGLVLGSMTEDETLKAEPIIGFLNMYVNMMSENIEKAKSEGKLASDAIETILREQLGVTMTSSQQT